MVPWPKYFMCQIAPWKVQKLCMAQNIFCISDKLMSCKCDNIAPGHTQKKDNNCSHKTI